MKVSQLRIASLLECRRLLSDERVVRDASFHRAADTGETQVYRARKAGWQPGTPVGVVAEEQHKRAPGQLRKLTGRAAEMISTQRDQH